MRFSQKKGLTDVRDVIQIDSIDERLENGLWNSILDDFFNKISTNVPSDGTDSQRGQVCLFIWKNFFGKRIDEIERTTRGRVYTPDFMAYLNNWFFKSTWYEKYDLIEEVSKIDRLTKVAFSKHCNHTLKIEMSGYRIVNGKIVQITSEEEILEIEEALANSSMWKPVEIHLNKGLEYYSNREKSDYRNSIKESISALEAFAKIISRDRKITLGKELTKIGEKYGIHKALISSFSSLYGYTSDSGGIRHSLLEGDILVNAEEAKYMLVSCSAFINYLKVKMKL